MANFGHLKKLTHLTVKYDLPDLGWGACALLLAPMSERNKGWLDDVLRRRALEKPSQTKPTETVVSRDQERRAEIEPIATHIIKGWSGIQDEAGNLVEFSVAACVDFLNALCDFAPDVFDRLRLFCLNPANFTPTLHVESLLKNS